MKYFGIIFFALGVSLAAHASDAVAPDAYQVCSNLGSYAEGYNVNSDEIKDCIKIVDGHFFSSEAFSICTNLRNYTDGYNFTGTEVNNCFAAISGRSYAKDKLQFCENLSRVNAKNSYLTSAQAVTDCLAK